MRQHIKGSIQRRGKSFRAFYWQSGQLRTATFRTERDARAWLLDLNQGVDTLVGAELADACAAIRLLREGCSLVDAVTYYNEHHIQASEYPLEAIAASFISDREKELRPATIRNYRQVLNKLLLTYNNIADLTTDNLRNWMRDFTPDNRNRAIRAISAFFSWCIDYHYANTNPAASIRLSKTDAPTRRVLTLDETRTLLQATLATDPRMMPYIAICLFAGVRPEECVKLTRAHITTDYIRITEDIAKTHQARTVPIHDNLKTILAQYTIHPNGVAFGITFDRVRKIQTAIIQASGIEWANDAMRHSYASYEYELTKDAATTAANLGHTTTATMFKHYRGLVEPTLGAQFFTILP